MRWLLIDQMLACTPGRQAVAVKTFALAELIFITHFPGHPVVPGVLLIEIVTQTAAKSLKVARPDLVSSLASVKSAKFLRPVVPGDRCVVTVDLEMDDQGAWARGAIEVEGTRVCQMTLRLAVTPRATTDPLEFDVIVDAWQRRQGHRHEPRAVGAHADTAAG